MYEAKRKEFLKELQQREESMKQMFVNKVKETEVELKEKEKEVRTEHAIIFTTDLKKKKPWVSLIWRLIFVTPTFFSFTRGSNS